MRTGSTTAKEALTQLQKKRRVDIRNVIEAKKKMIKSATSTRVMPIKIRPKPATINKKPRPAVKPLLKASVTTTKPRLPVVKPLPKSIVPRPIIKKKLDNLRDRLKAATSS